MDELKFLDKVKIVSGFYKGHNGQLVAVKHSNSARMPSANGLAEYIVKIFITAGKNNQSKVPVEVSCYESDLELVEDTKDKLIKASKES